jgi:hypothetical protein
MTTQLHLAIDTFALQLLLEGAQRLVDIIVANDDLHKKSSNSLKTSPAKAGISAGAGIADKHPAMHRNWVAGDWSSSTRRRPLSSAPGPFQGVAGRAPGKAIRSAANDEPWLARVETAVERPFAYRWLRFPRL